MLKYFESVELSISIMLSTGLVDRSSAHRQTDRHTLNETNITTWWR